MPSPRYTHAAEVFKSDFVPVMIPQDRKEVFDSVIQSCEALWKPDECYQTARSLLELLTLPDTRNFMSVLPTLPDTTLPITTDTDFDDLGYNRTTLALWTSLSPEQRETFAERMAGRLQWTNGLLSHSKDVRSDMVDPVLSSLAALARGESFTPLEEIRNWPGPSSGNPLEIEESIYTPRNVMIEVTDTSQAIRTLATSLQREGELVEDKIKDGVHLWESLQSLYLWEAIERARSLVKAHFRGWDGRLNYPELVSEPWNGSHDGGQTVGQAESGTIDLTQSSHLDAFLPSLLAMGNAWQAFMA
jgi:hypothetical protein